MNAEIDTGKLSPGQYALAIKQINDVISELPVTIHPPNSEVTGTPLRVNLGEPQQNVKLHGKHLDRIIRIASPDAVWNLAANPEGAADLTDRTATIKLSPVARKGERLNAEIFIDGLEKPVELDGIAKVAGPRPTITNATESFAGGSDVELRDREIPAGTDVSFAIQAQGVDSRSVMKVACGNDNETRRAVVISPGEKMNSAQLDFTGQGSFYLSLETGGIGDSGCLLTATVTDPETGTSEPFTLGRVIRLPHIDSLLVSDEKAGDSSYAATLTGQDLQLIAKAGWGMSAGEIVQGIPTPVPGKPGQQTLKISVPWPPPAPKAPLYIWLRGESDARRTNARY